ncbi:unnamed protein product, partial [Mesorhabditis spiculigera]
MGSEWMAGLPEPLTRIPIFQLAIPGSHDSGASSALSSKYPIANDEASNRFLNCFGRLTVSRRVVRRWAITQHASAKEQCQMGVRYFDLRVSNPPKRGPDGYHLVHALYGPDFFEFLREIRDFLDEHRKEVVILDMNHLFQIQPRDHDELEEQIVRLFGEDRFCRELPHDQVTLANLWAAGKQIICITALKDYPQDGRFWRGKPTICAPYPETNNLGELVEFLEVMQTKCRPTTLFQFYVTQGILTATGRDIVRNPFSSLEKHLATRATAAIRNWLTSYPHPELINIVIVDFVDAEYCREVVELNTKKLKCLK